jgi:glutamate-1-semialdehyde 2,1-aminomutase
VVGRRVEDGATQLNVTRASAETSADLFARSQEVIPGGVNSPARSFRAVGGTPRFIKSAAGAHITDADGNEFVDYVCSWGALLLGHAHHEVVRAVSDAARRGTSYGAPTAAELELAEVIRARVPAAEQVRLTSSGTEATMTAVRLARGCTGRAVIVRFDGSYHGHADSLLADASAPDPRTGIPDDIARNTVVLPYNDVAALHDFFTRRGDEVAAVIVEPIAANSGVVPPAEGFHTALREVTTGHGALLIHDEVITGFRVSPSGFQGLTGIRPDLLTFGKVIGGGLPVGAVAGSRRLMEHLAPLGPVFHAGTLSGNPVAVAAGLATLNLATPALYEALNTRAHAVADAIAEAFKPTGIPHQINYANGLFSLFFTETPVTDYASATRQSSPTYATFFHAMLDAGVYVPPSPYEAWFVSAAHDDATLQKTADALRHAAAKIVSRRL